MKLYAICRYQTNYIYIYIYICAIHSAGKTGPCNTAYIKRWKCFNCSSGYTNTDNWPVNGRVTVLYLNKNRWIATWMQVSYFRIPSVSHSNEDRGTHTHTHTNTQTHVHTYTHRHTHAQTHVHTHTHADTHTHTHTDTLHTETCPCTHTNTRTHKHAHT